MVLIPFSFVYCLLNKRHEKIYHAKFCTHYGIFLSAWQKKEHCMRQLLCSLFKLTIRESSVDVVCCELLQTHTLEVSNRCRYCALKWSSSLLVQKKRNMMAKCVSVQKEVNFKLNFVRREFFQTIFRNTSNVQCNQSNQFCWQL